MIEQTETDTRIGGDPVNIHRTIVALQAGTANMSIQQLNRAVRDAGGPQGVN